MEPAGDAARDARRREMLSLRLKLASSTAPRSSRRIPYLAQPAATSRTFVAFAEDAREFAVLDRSIVVDGISLQLTTTSKVQSDRRTYVIGAATGPRRTVLNHRDETIERRRRRRPPAGRAVTSIDRRVAHLVLHLRVASLTIERAIERAPSP